MNSVLKNINFDEPQKVFEYFTSLEVDYSEQKDLAQILVETIQDVHTNKEECKFQAITQCILEALKRIHNFNSSKWVSESKLEHELKAAEYPICFSRLNAKGEICEYKIINFDQIDFSKEIQYADEYKIVSKPKKTIDEEKQKEDNEEFNKVFALLLNGENVFLTGYAGTGKSYILNKLKEKFKNKLTITSTTGIAAVNIKGQTLHSWAGVGLCKNPIYKTVEKIRTRATTLKQILNCKILAIDEISMLNIETFEYVDQVLKAVRNSFEPFGGIQVLFIGDFFQLPPVEKNDKSQDATFFGEPLQRRFCFDSPLWDDFKLKNIVLKKNYRQSEEKFIKALSDMRTNCLTKDDIKLLQTRETNLDTYETDILHIFSTNDEANRYNTAKFNMIDEPVKIFTASDTVYRCNKPINCEFTENEQHILEIFGKNCRAEKDIALKLGAKVMLLINLDFNKGLINGSCGIITGFDENTITVKFDNGITYPIPKHKFEYYYHDKVAAERTQFPLRLAYGITIHKSQGMTLDKLVIDCSRIFERGQAYVAMSRVKTLEGLYLKSFSPEKVMVDSKVAKFYENLQEVQKIPPINQLLFDFNKDDEKPKITEEEAKKLIIECVKEFDGMYGKNGICNILYGSRSISNNEFHQKAAESHFFASLNCAKKKVITSLIDDLISEGHLRTKHITFGRPILCFNKSKDLD